MATSVLADAFGHHTWASMRILDACAELDDAQLASSVPGTYGSILDTLRHLVGSDCWYLFRLGGERHPLIEEEGMSVPELRAEMARNASAWEELLEGDLDPDTIISTVRDDGSASHAARGIRLAQVIHHGTDHRSQVCTALTALGLKPPEIDVWDYGRHVGRLTEIEAPPA